MIPRIVITGGPGSGKTVCLQKLKHNPALNHFLFFEELARRLLQEKPQFREQRREFHREIYRLQTAREAAAGERPFISDRGTIDAFAFHPETIQEVGTTIEREYQRYTAVIHLGSAARLGAAYYLEDEVRNESVDDALVIERAIEQVWKKHPGYIFLDAEEDFAAKCRRCEEAALDLAGMRCT